MYLLVNTKINFFALVDEKRGVLARAVMISTNKDGDGNRGKAHGKPVEDDIIPVVTNR